MPCILSGHAFTTAECAAGVQWMHSPRVDWPLACCQPQTSWCRERRCFSRFSTHIDPPARALPCSILQPLPCSAARSGHACSRFRLPRLQSSGTRSAVRARLQPQGAAWLGVRQMPLLTLGATAAGCLHPGVGKREKKGGNLTGVSALCGPKAVLRCPTAGVWLQGGPNGSRSSPRPSTEPPGRTSFAKQATR